MPAFPPRSEATKKHDQFFKREAALRHAILKKVAPEKILKAAEKYRDARLLLLKAQLHVNRENGFQKKNHSFNIDKINAELVHWTNITGEEIVNGFK
jgi:hypothetical protein